MRAWLVALMLLASLPASADGLVAARARFDRAVAAYDAGHYDAALEEFAGLHQQTARPELHFNIGRCLERLQRWSEAIAAYERYLEALPQADNRVELEGRVRVLRAVVARPASSPRRKPLSRRWVLWVPLSLSLVVVGTAVGLGVGLTRERDAPVPDGVGAVADVRFGP